MSDPELVGAAFHAWMDSEEGQEVCRTDHQGTIAEGAWRAAVAAERERCLACVHGAMSDQGTDDPHTALRWAAEAIERGAKL